MKWFITSAVTMALVSNTANVAYPATLVATYSFNDTLAPDSGVVPSLVSIDPLGLNGFENALVNGQNQRVFKWSGNGNNPSLNAGLRLDATGLVAYDNYSVELTFEFSELSAFGGGWRRVIDTQNRQSDNGFYVAPNNALQVYPVVTGSTVFTTPGFHNVVLSNYVVNGTREVKAYLDGKLELVSSTDQLNLVNSNNPGHLLHFFVDNIAGPAQQEFANGRIASLRLYDGIVTPSIDPPVATAQEPTGILGIVLGGGFAYLNRRRSV
jgi:hypothetical protein